MHFHVGKISITARSISKLLEKMMTVAIVWVGAMLIFDSKLTVGSLVAFQMIAGRVSGPLVQLVSLVHSYQEAALSDPDAGRGHESTGRTRHGPRLETAGQSAGSNSKT